MTGTATGFVDRRQIDVAHPVGELVGQLRSDLHGQPGLAGTPGAGHRDQPVLGDQLPQLRHFGLPPHETGQAGRKIVRRTGIDDPQRRELGAHVGVAQLHHPLRAGQIPQQRANPDRSTTTPSGR